MSVNITGAFKAHQSHQKCERLLKSWANPCRRSWHRSRDHLELAWKMINNINYSSFEIFTLKFSVFLLSSVQQSAALYLSDIPTSSYDQCDAVMNQDFLIASLPELQLSKRPSISVSCGSFTLLLLIPAGCSSQLLFNISSAAIWCASRPGHLTCSCIEKLWNTDMKSFIILIIWSVLTLPVSSLNY